MARAYINLEDAGDGSFHARVVFAGGWDKTSHAHQYANLLMKELGGIAEPLSDPVVETTDAPTAPGEGWVSATPTLGRQ